MKTPSDEFVTWCRAETPKAPSNYHFELHQYLQNPPNNPAGFIGVVQHALVEGSKLLVHFNDSRGKENVLLTKEQLSYGDDISLLQLSLYEGNFSFVGLSIGDYSINVTGQYEVVFRNCAIRRLTIHPSHSVTLINCQIGTLALGNSLLRHFDMRGGCILNIECNPPWKDSPFTGSVTMSDVFLPRKPMEGFIRTPQPYRNLRAHLRSLENSQGANLLHSAELAIERESDNKTNKVLSHAYELFSDFGSSASRPLIWLFLLWLVSFVTAFISDGAALAYAANDYTGWRSLLMCNDLAGRGLRAAVLSFQQLASPLTIIGAKPLLIPKYLLLAVWAAIHSLFSAVLIALLILAIRRRFKMQ